MSITSPSVAQKLNAQRNAKILRESPMLMLALSTEYAVEGFDNIHPNYFSGAFFIPLGPELSRLGLPRDIGNDAAIDILSERVRTTALGLVEGQRNPLISGLSLDFVSDEASGFKGIVARMSALADEIAFGASPMVILEQWSGRLASPIAATLGSASSSGFVADYCAANSMGFPIHDLWLQAGADSLRALVEAEALSAVAAPSSKAPSRISL